MSITVKIDSELLHVILQYYDRPESVAEFERVIELHTNQATDARDQSLKRVTVGELVEMLDNRQKLEILENQRLLGAD